MSRALLLLLLLVSAGTVHADDGAFSQVTAPRPFTFPRDHGAHPDFQTEWWYFTGHLEAEDKRTFGFELVFFRVGLRPGAVNSQSNWATNSLYLAHFALTDDSRSRFQFYERRSRGAFAEAGASTDTLSCWNGPWRAELGADGAIRLTASESDEELKLELRSQKPIVLHGDRGMSRKGAEPGAASFYTSYTRLEGTGSIRVDGEQFRIVRASAWLDQEVTSSERSHGTQGWDWFAIQLDTGEELMLYQLRDKEGRPTEFSAGTLINIDGTSRSLRHNEFKLEVLGEWTSARSGVRYPARWRITLPGYQLEVEPTVADQELTTEQSTKVTYWEGRARVRGSKGERIVLGNSYVELVGYR